MRTELKLDIDENLAICVDETEFDIIGNIVRRHATQIVETKDNMVREALVFLGWAPPEKEKTVEELKASGILRQRGKYGKFARE